MILYSPPVICNQTTPAEADLEGDSGGSLELPSGTKLFQFQGEILKNEVIDTNC